MAYTQPEQDAIDRLDSFYNGDAFDAGTNAGGMAEGGHRQNFEPALKDTATAGAAVARIITAVDAPDLLVRSTEFRKRFLGALAAAPTEDGNGDAVTEGALYWDLNTAAMRVWNGANWVAPAPSAADYVPDTGGVFGGPVQFLAGLDGDLTGDVTGNVTGDVDGDATGNAGTATKLKTARAITLTGDASGSISFDGSANKNLAVTVQNNSHSHTLATISDAGSMAGQNKTSVDIDGGAIDNTPIGQTTPKAGKFTALEGTALTATSINGAVVPTQPQAESGARNDLAMTPLATSRYLAKFLTDMPVLSLRWDGQFAGAIDVVKTGGAISNIHTTASSGFNWNTTDGYVQVPEDGLYEVTASLYGQSDSTMNFAFEASAATGFSTLTVDEPFTFAGFQGAFKLLLNLTKDQYFRLHWLGPLATSNSTNSYALTLNWLRPKTA
ncbi:MAG: hypothetical protein ABF335_03205 [Alphaproteobacteria bacterium]